MATPQDTVTQLGSRVNLDCSVTSMSATDSVTWWFSDGETYQQLFTSNAGEPGSSALADTDNYEISDQYNLVVKSATFRDAGTYTCEISGYRNYSAELSVLGNSVLPCFFQTRNNHLLSVFHILSGLFNFVSKVFLYCWANTNSMGFIAS